MSTPEQPPANPTLPGTGPASEHAPQDLAPSPCPPAPTVIMGRIEVEAPVPERPLLCRGDRIGHYTLIRKIGTGGFGNVWMALAGGAVPRTVALKVISVEMGSSEVIARFEAERKLLAVMDHPAIAKVFDAGSTETGLPYFVMELVEGEPITRFCSSQKLSTSERLKLFVQVCGAVQHAHQKGVIHRDIKPNNVLVLLNDGHPVPKVIDFGIAKATQTPPEEHDPASPADLVIGTPAYMSPEQTSAEADIDTRSDVYSLGVLLYEMLTGVTPFDQEDLPSRDFEEVRRIIREVEPPRPSARLAALGPGKVRELALLHQSTPGVLISQLRGDLDWIVMKAMDKDRTRRYDTANGLAMDIRRHLLQEPVLARPPTAVYRINKFVKRNRTIFTMGAVLGSALVMGSIISIGQAVRATRAEHQENILRLAAQESEADAYNEARRAAAAEQKARQQHLAARGALAQAQLALADAAYREQDGSAMMAALQQVPEPLRGSNWHYLEQKSDSSHTTLRSRTGSPVLAAAADPSSAGVFALLSADHRVEIVKARSGGRMAEFMLPFDDRSSPDFCVAVSPDGTRLASAKHSGSAIMLQNMQDGRVLGSWMSAGTSDIQFSPDGRHLLEVIGAGELRLRDAADGSILWSQNGGASSIRAVFVPGGEFVLFHRSVSGPKLSLLRITDGTEARRLPDPRFKLTCLGISPDGTRALCGDIRGFVRCLDLTAGTVRYEFRANDRALHAVQTTADGTQFATLASLSGSRQSLQMWDTGSGVLLQPLLGGNGVGRDLCIHPRSNELLTTGSAVKVWTLEARREQFRLSVRDTATDTAFMGTEDYVFAQGTTSAADLIDLRQDKPQQNPVWNPGSPRGRLVSVSADGSLAAIAAPAKETTSVHLLRWKDNQFQSATTWSVPGNIAFLRMAPAGDRVLVRSPNAFYVCDAATGTKTTELWPRPGAIADAVWAGPNRVAALLTSRISRGLPRNEDRIMVFDATTARQICMASLHEVVNAIASSPDGSTIATAGADRIVRLRDTATLELRHEMRAHDAPIMALAYHPHSTILATASEDLSVKLWRLNDCTMLEKLQGPVGPPKQLVFSPRGTRLACLSDDRTLRIWETTRQDQSMNITIQDPFEAVLQPTGSE